MYTSHRSTFQAVTPKYLNVLIVSEIILSRNKPKF